MIYIDCLCDNCKNEDDKSKPHPKCKAYPEGIPYEWYINQSADDEKRSGAICNNGIGFTPREDRHGKG